jgi:hypothetical protein
LSQKGSGRAVRIVFRAVGRLIKLIMANSDSYPRPDQIISWQRPSFRCCWPFRQGAIVLFFGRGFRDDRHDVHVRQLPRL